MADQEATKVVVAEAFNKANDYWMLGWDWEEIGAVLADSGYTEPIIANAVRLSQEHARKVLKNGPFSQIHEGQRVKLTSGMIGTVVSVNPETLTIQDADGTYRVGKDLLDELATQNLRDAANLREAAKIVLKKAQTVGPFQQGELVSDPLEEEEPEVPAKSTDMQKRPRGRPRKNPKPESKELVPVEEPKKEITLPGPPQREMIKPEPTETFSLGLTPTKRAPTGWGEYPKMEDIAEVSSLVTPMIEELDEQEKEYRVVEGDIKALNEMARDLRKKEKELGTSKLETAKKIYAIIATETKDVEEMGTKVFLRYKNSLVGVQQAISAMENPLDAADELEAVKDILSKNFPKISEEVQKALDLWKVQNTTIQEQITKTLVYFSPKKEKTGQFLEALVGWVNKAWEATKKITKRLDSILFPRVDQSIAVMESFQDVAGKQKVKATIDKWMNK
jgi:RNAse (barnase) inhibitor barstar